MAYEPTQYQNSFRPSIQGQKFNPVKAIDESKKIKEQTAAEVQNIKTLAQNEARQYQVDKMNQAAASREQRVGFQNAELGKKADVASTMAMGKAFQGLLSLTQTGMNFYQQEQERREKEAAEQLEIDDKLDAVMGEPGVSAPEPLSAADTAQLRDQDAAIAAEAQAATEIGQQLRQEGGLLNQSVASQIENSTGAATIRAVQGNAYAARAAYPAFLAEVVEAIPADQRPRSFAEAQDLIQQASRKFLTETGLIGMDKKRLADILGGTMVEVSGNAIRRMVTEGDKATQQENLTAATSQISALVDANTNTSFDAESVWRKAELIVSTGGFGYTRGVAGAQKALEMVLQEAKTNGNVPLIEALEKIERVPGNPKTKLGLEYDHLFDKAKEQARERNITLFNHGAQDRAFAVKQALQAYQEDASVENRKRAIETLSGMGTIEAQAAIAELTTNGLDYDFTVAADFLEEYNDKGFVDQERLEQARESGQINEDEYKRFAYTNEDIKNAKEVDKVMKDQAARFRGAVMGNTINGAIYKNAEASPQMRQEMRNRQQFFQDEVRSRLKAAFRDNPGIADDPAALMRVVGEIESSLLKEPRYQIQDDGLKGYSFASPMGLDFPIKSITISPGVENYTELSVEQVDQLGIPTSLMNPGKDWILDNRTLQNDSIALLEGKELSQRTKDWAKKLGIAPSALVNSQLYRAGKPSLSTMRRSAAAAESAGATNGQPSIAPTLTAKQGMAKLQAMGFSRRGAAFLAGNIQQESSWNGARSWGEVAGDGSDRNGGLVSWMDDAQRNHWRLTNIEKFLGKPISQASVDEQLEALKWEMEKNYPRAYATFRREASTRDLISASKAYWGYGHEGSRYAYAQGLLGN